MNTSVIRELKQQRRGWQRKRHFTREYALLQTLSSLFHLVQFVKCLQIFLELIMKDCIEIEEKNEKVSRLCSRPPQNVKLGTFTWYSRVVTAKKCTRKRDARAKLLFCRSKPTAFLPFSLPSPLSLLKLPIVTKKLIVKKMNFLYSKRWTWFKLKRDRIAIDEFKCSLKCFLGPEVLKEVDLPKRNFPGVADRCDQRMT